MSILMTIRVAFKALGRNKMRTALTMLGMIIGVAAVIAMIALGRGATDSIETQIKAAGTNLIYVSAGNFMQGGVRMGSGASARLTVDDANALREIQGVQYLSINVNTRAQIISGNQNWQSRIQGVEPDLPNIRVWPVDKGQFFSAQDVATASKVAVFGATVAEQLFGEGVDPVGQIVRIKNQPFKVVGVMGRKGQSSGGFEDQDDSVMVPYTTAQKKLMGQQHINQVMISAASAGEVASVAGRITEVMRVRHQIFSGDSDDFTVRTMEEMAAMRTETIKTMSALLAGIAAVSLLVGGIGIMNIMLVSVTERTREIGLRMAIGARSRDVLLQFLVEAVVLSLFGGMIGIAIGFGISQGITMFLTWPTQMSSDAVLLAFGFAAFTGIFFGFYPATKAAQLDPIDALRFE
ncbi:MAG: ABC transporter permease [Acidobacteriota bacterium]